MQTNNNTTKHRAGIAAVLSFIFNGLGQLYNGEITKGLVIIFLSATGLFLVIFGAVLIYFWIRQIDMLGFLWSGLALFIIGILTICIIGIYSIKDAYKQASK